MNVYKFSPTATDTAPDITADELIDKMKNGNRFMFGMDNLTRDGVFKLNGWAFDIRDELHLYVIRQYGEWRQVYAPNRTSLRHLVYGRIDKILEDK